MAYKRVELYCDRDKARRLEYLKEDPSVIEAHMYAVPSGLVFCSFLTASHELQHITDILQAVIGKTPDTPISVSTVDTIIPKPETSDPSEEEAPSKPTRKFFGVSREVLLEDVSKGVDLDSNFLFLVVCSTIVAAIGLIEDNVAVVIGAMVIAPLLGPNLALSFGTALGDTALMGRAAATNLVGIALCLLISAGIGYFWTGDLVSDELWSRTRVSFEVIVLAIVSGAAAVLSLTRGISSVMVGVMVAVALLPPATTVGIMLGAGNFSASLGALLLLSFNIVCVNLSAIVTLRVRGVRPRTWFERKTATLTVRWYMAFWALAFAGLVAVLLLKLVP